MSSVARIMLYMMTWQRIGKWLVMLGLMVLASTPVIALFFSSAVAYGIWLLATVAVLFLPFMVAPIAFRYLISNERLSLAPNFHFLCGVALLLLTLLQCTALPLGAVIYTVAPLPALLGIKIFIGASVYVFLVQWAVTSRFIGILMGVLPLLIIIALNMFAFRFRELFNSQVLLLFLFALCCLFWVWGLRVLLAKNFFTAPLNTPLNHSHYLWSSNDWFARTLQANMRGAIKSSQDTLLQGFPDSWKSRIIFTINLVIIAPLVCTCMLAILGIARENPRFQAISLTAIFLLFSLITALITSVSCGELAARSRFIWLRTGSDRKSLWHCIEKLLLTNLLILNVITATTALLSMLISDQTRITPLNYFLTIAGGSLLGAYFSLTARIRQWSTLTQLIIMLVLGPGIAWALVQHMAWTFLQHTVPFIVVALLLAGLALYFRLLAMSAFVHIDWTQVKPVPRSRIIAG